MNQLKPGDYGTEGVHVIKVDLHATELSERWFKKDFGDGAFALLRVVTTPPKPSVWQGPHRLVRENWWDISSAKNTAVCICLTEWLAYVDDRCVLGPKWLQAVRDAMAGHYAVAGSYEKRFGMESKDGKITHAGEVTGVDPRIKRLKPLQPTFGGEFYGCTQAMPLEWLLEMNGWQEEGCAGIGLEDVIMGNRLSQNGHTIKFDPRMHIIEDRPRDAGEGMPHRADKGISPNDKSHKTLEVFGGGKWSNNQINLRQEREKIQRGEPWTIPTEPRTDFYDGQPLSAM